MGEDVSRLVLIEKYTENMSKDIVFVVESGFNLDSLSIFAGLDSFCTEEDRIGLIEYNETVHISFGLIKRTGLHEDMMEKEPLEANGSAMFDALDKALSLLRLNDFVTRHKWIVLFTCGHDDSSVLSIHDLMRTFTQLEVNLVVVGCEMSAKDIYCIRSLVDLSPRGLMMSREEDVGITLMRYIYPNNLPEIISN